MPLEEPTLTRSDSSELDALLDANNIVDVKDGAAPEPPPVPEPPVPAEPPVENPEPTEPVSPTSEPPTDPAATPPADPTATPATEPPLPDPELDAIQEPRNMSPNNRVNWRQLDGVARTRLKTIKELTSKVQELESKVSAPPQVPEEIQKQLSELTQFRRVFDIQNDPEFKQKYDTTIENNRSVAYDILSRNFKMEPAQLEAIKKTGIENIDPQVLEETVLKPLMSGDINMRRDGVALKKLIENNLGLMFEKDQAIKSAAAEGSKWQQERETLAKTQAEQFETAVRTTVQAVQAKVPWAKLQTVPPNATPEVKAKIEKENAFFNEKVKPVFRAAMYDNNPNVRAQMAMTAVLAYKYSEELEASAAREKKLTEEIGRLRSAGKSRPEAPMVPPSRTPSPSKLLSMNDKDAVEAGLDAITNSQ